ncbi:amino acid adenylation domain-containing protein [Microbulbifer sp. SH-1]|nr:amino acid adenylation domain-containing protein [Microbulbifer sp. SH-1]
MVMREITAVIEQLTSAGVYIFAESGKLKTKCPKEKLTPHVVALIKNNKDGLLRYLARQDSLSNDIDITIRRRALRSAPQSFSQRRLWLLDQIEGGSPQYNMARVLRFSGELDISALQRSFETLIQRHESLRTTFRMNGEQVPVQEVHDAAEFSIPTHDISQLADADRETEMARLIAFESTKPFDLNCSPMLRASLIKLGKTEHVLLFTMHHISSDGWSIGLVMKELSTLYSAYLLGANNPFPPLEIQYSDYAQWQLDNLQGSELDRQIGYWKKKLYGLPAVHNLPLDGHRPQKQSFAGSTHVSYIDKAATAALRTLCQRQGATLFMGLHAAFSTLLSRYSREHDIVIGTPVSNREQTQVSDLIGFFVNTLILRTDFSGRPTFNQLLEQCKTTTLEAYEHQQIPFEVLLEELKPARSLAYSPLFQVMLVLQPVALKEIDLPGVKVSFEGRETQVSVYDLTLNVTENEAGMELEWEFNSDLFETETITRMSQHFDYLLSGLVRQPATPIDEIPLLSPSEQQDYATRWNPAYTEYPDKDCIHTLFEAQVQSSPDAVALIFDNVAVSYAELNSRANQLAHLLITEHKIEPDTRVGICLERSLDMVLAMLAILKAGGAYVPLDPAYPRARLAYMVDDANLNTVVVQTSTQECIPLTEVRALCLDDVSTAAAVAQCPGSNPTRELTGVDPRSLAYVIYTSGSTGAPKGVMVEHANIVNFLTSMAVAPGLTSADCLLAVTSICFDIHGLEIFLPLIRGAKLVLASKTDASDPERIKRSLRQHKVSIMQATPATWKMLIESNWQVEHPIKILCGGEALTKPLAKALLRRPGISLWNMYGPTETTIWSCVNEIGYDDERILVGQPIANTQVYIASDDMTLAPIGVPGELLIAGHGVARGYLNREELTRERFIHNPFRSESEKGGSGRLYRTGDLARRLSDGNIEFLGRIDQQVKVRGFRIELGEIEATLISLSEVKDAVVVTHSIGESEPMLVAYVVSEQQHSEQEIDLSGRLRDHLTLRLPHYMIPAFIVRLDALPLTANGKIDRNALPSPNVVLNEEEFNEPTTECEKELAEIWKSVLKIEKVSANDQFFDIGGDSISAIRLISRVEDLGATLSVRDIYEFPDLSALARHVEKQRRSNVETGSRSPVTSMGEQKLLPKQLQLLNADNGIDGDLIDYILLDAPQALDNDFLLAWLMAMHECHPVLNVRILAPDSRTDTHWGKDWKAVYQQLDPADIQSRIHVADVSKLSVEEKEDYISAQKQALQQSLTSIGGPMLEVVLIKDDESTGKSHLLLGIQRLLLDRASIGVLLDDLESAYQDYLNGGKIALSKSTFSYQEYGESVKKLEQSKHLLAKRDTWLSILRTPSESLCVEDLTREPPVETSFTSTTLSDKHSAILLTHSIEMLNATVEELVYSSLSHAIYCWQGTELTLRVDVERSDRLDSAKDKNMRRLLGTFEYTYPTVAQCSPFGGVKRVPEKASSEIGRISRQGLDYGLISQACGDRQFKDQAASNQAEIFYKYHGQIDPSLRSENFEVIEGMSLSTLEPRNAKSYMLSLNVAIAGGRIHLIANYSRGITNTEARRLLDDLEGQLNQYVNYISDHLPDSTSLSCSPVLMAPTVRYLLENQKWRTHFNVKFMMGFRKSSFNMALLEESFNRLVERHDGLRFRIVQQDEAFSQYIAPKGIRYRFEEIDLSAYDAREGVARLEAAANRLHQSFSFSLDQPLFKVAHIKLNKDLGDRLLLIFHHMIVDGASIRSIVKELYVGYSILLNQAQIEIPGSSSVSWLENYYDAFDRADRDQELTFWKTMPWDELASVKYLKDADTLARGRESTSSQNIPLLDGGESEKLTNLIARDGSSLLFEALILGFYRAFKPRLTSTRVLMELVNDNRGVSSLGKMSRNIVGNVTSNDFLLFDFSVEDQCGLLETLENLREQRLGFKAREKSLMTLLYGENRAYFNQDMSTYLPLIGLNFMVEERDRSSSLKDDMPSYIWPAVEGTGNFESRELDGVRTHAMFVGVVLVPGEGLSAKTDINQGALLNIEAERVLQEYQLAMKNMVHRHATPLNCDHTAVETTA